MKAVFEIRTESLVCFGKDKDIRMGLFTKRFDFMKRFMVL